MENIYNGKRVLITGHTGFKGSWLTLWLQKLGAEVIGYALDPLTERDNYSLTIDKDSIKDIRGDIRDTHELDKVFKLYKPQIVFHLAAQPLVLKSYEDPKYTYEVNVMGTLNLLLAASQCEDTKAIIVVTSDKCYKNNEWIYSYREEDTLGGHDPYSSSKAAVEILTSSFRSSFYPLTSFDKPKKLIATVRAGNVIGGGDWSPNRIVPDSIKALEAQKSIEIRNYKSVRPWQHVLEPLSGYLLVGSLLIQGEEKYSGAWNFGPKDEGIITVEEIVQKIIKYYGRGSYYIKPPTGTTLHEAGLLSLDISKARRLLNWEPKWTVEEAVEKTLLWYKEYKSKNIKKITEDILNSYKAY